jgi:acyl carrier protein
MIDEKLGNVLLNHLPDAARDEPLRPEATLVDLGIDSVRLVEFIIDLEDSFGVVIPDEAMLAENFSTVGAVSALVDRLLSVSSGQG